MNYGIAEQEIADRLNSFFAAQGKAAYYEAALMPENEHQFEEFYSNWTKARVAIQYIDSDYDPGISTGIMLQQERARFRCTFETRKLRGEGGFYNLVELTKLALVGYQLTDTHRLSILKYGLLEFEQGAWQPYLEFECRTLNAQLHDDNTETAIGGILQSVTGIDYFDCT